ncbi:MAG: PIN domain-containing protein, partial [Chloroflexota bacterium]|nr:PIN domain-containing protein [Chloroflexota bacterium]
SEAPRCVWAASAGLVMTFMSAEFCDTNVIAYAYDKSAPAKQASARRLLGKLWTSGNGRVSVQVLQELYVTLTRKAAFAMPVADARDVVRNLATWRHFTPGAPAVVQAIDEAQRLNVSFWDAMLIVAANDLGCSVLWSEDFSDGQQYGSVTVRNPFAR